MADDFSNDFNTTGRLTVGGTTTGTLENGYDADWFRVTLTAGQVYQFTLNGYYQGGGYLNTGFVDLSLYDGSGQVVDAYYGAGYGSTATAQINYVAGKSGDYFLGLASWDLKTSGSYSVAAAVVPQGADDYPAGTATTGVLTPGTAMHARFDSATDVDWFKFHADPGQHFKVTFGTGIGLVSGSEYLFYDAAGNAQPISNTFPFEPLAGGDYYVSVRGGQAGAYDLTLQALADDYSANDGAAGQASVGGTVQGVMNYRLDSDRFQISLEAGQVYTLTLNTSAALHSHVSLTCVDSSGVAPGLGGGTYADAVRLYVMPSKSGVYSINVKSDYGWDGSDGQYTLAVTAATDDYGNTNATAAPLAIGSQLDGAFQVPSADRDVFKLDLQAGTTYLLGAAAAANGSSAGMYFNLYDSGGKQLLQVGAASSYTPAVSGSYYLEAYASVLGNYTVSASLAPDDHGANAGAAGSLTLGVKTAGELEAGGGDRDWYGVALEAGTTYWFSLGGSSQGDGTLPRGGQLRLLDSKGALVASIPNSNAYDSPVLSFAPSIKGTYYAEISAPYGQTGTYQVLAQVGVRDDYGSDMAHASTLALDTAKAGKLELGSDADMFKFSATAGTTYALTLKDSSGRVTYGLSLSGVDGSNSPVGLRDTGYASDKVVKLFTAVASGDYYFSVYNGSSSGTGAAYTLTPTSYGQDDYAASTKTAAELAMGGRLSGAISFPDDKDWVKVHLESGRSYVFDLQGALSGGGTLDASLYAAGLVLHDSNGYNVASQSGSGQQDARLKFVARSSGDYYLEVYGNGTAMGSYTLAATLTSTDVAAPQLTSMTAATGLGLNDKIVLSFNEIVMLGSTAGVALSDAAGQSVPLAGSGGAPITVQGQTLSIDPAVALQPGMTYTLTLPAGSVLDLAGNQAAIATSYTFSTVPAAQAGTNGNDLFVGTGKGLNLNGGAGIDTVYYNDRANYVWITRSNGELHVHDNSSYPGDLLTGIERIQFSDHALALDIDGHGGQAYRLYQAAFNRAPDNAGLGFWIAALDRGMSLQAAAGGFIASPEFQQKYGSNPSDADYVSQLYRNVLHRDGDASGTAFWLDALHNGHSRAEVLAFFSESPENQAALIGQIGNGVAYTPYA
jgi:hypothetical protein